MNILITAGPTREPIDPVRYLGNRSSGKMGLALVQAALRHGDVPTLILGPGCVSIPNSVRRINVETAAQMRDAVMHEYPTHDLLIMAAAVADYRPLAVSDQKLSREGRLVIECEATEDIVAAASAIKRPNQRTIGFSLESADNLDRAREKLLRKNLDLIVFNPTQTMSSDAIDAVLLWPDGRNQPVGSRSKADFADILIHRAAELFD